MTRPVILLAMFLALAGSPPGWAAFRLEEPSEAAPPRPPQPEPQQRAPRQRPPAPAERAPTTERAPSPERAPAAERAPAPDRAPAEASPAPAAEPQRTGSATATDGEGWAVDPRSRCRVFVGEMRPGETISYSGRCSGGLASGEGEVQRRAGERVLFQYQGTFANGRLNGPGTRIATNGDRIEAPFVDGRATGRGVLRFRGLASDIYEGFFRNDQPNGQGVRSWPDGARYEGDWVNGARSGIGQQVFSDGARYSGGWRGDRPHGRGEMYYANGDIYDGDWVDGRRSGLGTFRWFAPGRSGIYEGQWLDDRRHGNGRESFAAENGIYEGEYVSDRPQGRGVYVVGAERFSGEVSNGCMRTAFRAVPVGLASGGCR